MTLDDLIEKLQAMRCELENGMVPMAFMLYSKDKPSETHSIDTVEKGYGQILLVRRMDA